MKQKPYWINHQASYCFRRCRASIRQKFVECRKTQKAVDVFKLNAKNHPEDKFTTNVGLARGYTALGDKKNAIKHWELAIKNLPENQKPNLAFYEGEVKN